MSFILKIIKNGLILGQFWTPRVVTTTFNPSEFYKVLAEIENVVYLENPFR